MSTQLPAALAAALARAKAQHASGAVPSIPFIAQPLAVPNPGQDHLFGPPPAPPLDWNEWEAQLLGHAGPLQRYLGFSDSELADEARLLPIVLCKRSEHEPYDSVGARMVAAAERMFGQPVPGQNVDAQLARIRDPRYWRRFLTRRVRAAREHLYLKLGLIGAGARQYCSADAQSSRRSQLQKQTQWLQETMLRGVVDGKTVEIPLVQVAKSQQQKLARLYAFIKAMDRQAKDNALTVAMLTTSLEGKWHANPKFANDSHRWNGSQPTEANRELGVRFQNIRRDLAKKDIALSGLWAGEPHQDGCPHRHHWLIYAPEHEREVLAAFLKYFPSKIKLRRDGNGNNDAIIESREDALAGVTRPKTHAGEGAQVDVVVIDREKGSGASYILKYVMKAVLSDASHADLVTPLGATPTTLDVPTSARPKANARDTRKELRKLHSVDAHRATWGMRSFQFFGIKNCLSLWDELRRVKTRPQDPYLQQLWRLARGGDGEGTLTSDQQRGDAYGFLVAMGGLAATPKPAQAELEMQALPRARIYTVETETRYGETGQRIEGVVLVQTGVVEPLETIQTRTVRWELVPKAAKTDESAGDAGAKKAEAGGKACGTVGRG